MKRILLILSLIFIVQNVNAARLLAMYQKMRKVREHENILKADSLMAENGNVDMQLTCALRYWGKGDYSTARHFLDKAVKAKNDTAMVYLAEMNYYGYGIPSPDVDSALKLANKALSIGNTFSNFIIGKFHYDMEDYVKAFKYFTSVPDNYPNIRLNNYYIAKCYRYGRGVQLDTNQSIVYFQKAYMSRTPDWWEKHHHRIKELNQISEIAEILGIDPNPDFVEVFLLSETRIEGLTSKSNFDINEYKMDEVVIRNMERKQKEYTSLFHQLEEQSK